jgi:uncharacterized membrane protein YvbJ
MVFCGRCGQENPADSKFCTRCANPLTQVPPPPAPAQQWQPAPPPYVPPKKNNNTLILIVVVIVVLIVAVSIYAAWVVFRIVDEFPDNQVTVTVTSDVSVTMDLTITINGEVVETFTLGPGESYQNTYPFDPWSTSGSNLSEVIVTRYDGGSIYNTYTMDISQMTLDQEGHFIADFQIID